VDGLTVRVCILRVGGTNCDYETKVAFESLDVSADIIHMNYLTRGLRKLLDYDLLVIPGGFSYGDYVRAGAIWGKRLIAYLRSSIEDFLNVGGMILGICNGFQVLIEAGLLPGFNGISSEPEAVLSTNISARYECRWIHVIHEFNGCILTSKIPYGEVLRMPVGHGEGRFLIDEDSLEKLIRNRQIVFRYSKPNGEPAGGEYPYNPNGSIYDIAGICNPDGNILGLMPHPERAFFKWQLPDWTSLTNHSEFGDGYIVFNSICSVLANTPTANTIAEAFRKTML
jgi:phosphoribosylformylglycinamidine synthase